MKITQLMNSISQDMPESIIIEIMTLSNEEHVRMLFYKKLNFVAGDKTTALYLAAKRESPTVFLKLLSNSKLNTEIINQVTSNQMFPTILMLFFNKNQEWNEAYDRLAPKLNADHVIEYSNYRFLNATLMETMFLVFCLLIKEVNT